MPPSPRRPVRRRLLLLTALAAAGGALFAPFVLANPAADAPAAPVVFAAFAFGAAVVTALSAWGGLRWADKVGMPMPILRAWESRRPVASAVSGRTVGVPLVLVGLVGLVAALVANAVGVPANPGSLPVRAATTLFAAVVPAVLVHLLVMSGLVLVTRRVWVAVVASAVVFVALFHGDPPTGSQAWAHL